MKFTQDDQTYTGFTRIMWALREGGVVAPTGPVNVGDTIVIAWFDGEPDLWRTDGTPNGLAELRRLYADQWGPTRTTFTVLRAVATNPPAVTRFDALPIGARFTHEFGVHEFVKITPTICVRENAHGELDRLTPTPEQLVTVLA